MRSAGEPISQREPNMPRIPTTRPEWSARQMSGSSRYGFRWYFQSRYAVLVATSPPQR
jgi:hypothetical protein